MINDHTSRYLLSGQDRFFGVCCAMTIFVTSLSIHFKVFCVSKATSVAAAGWLGASNELFVTGWCPQFSPEIELTSLSKFKTWISGRRN